MHKNAGIKSMEEAVCRLESGEKFHYMGEDITYDESKIYRGMSPFRYGEDSLEGVWYNYSEWNILITWENTVSRDNPVLCWCWETDEHNKKLELVIRFDSDDPSLPYRTNTGNWWENAVPATRKEVEKYFV